MLRRAEALVPAARVNTVYLGEEGVAHVGVEARPGDPPLAFDSLLLDRVTGAELGRVKWGGLPTTLAAIMPFVYSLHYELAVGTVGAWILGFVALAWTIDCFVGFYLTLPLPSRANARSWLARWKPAWLIKLRGSFYRVNFDLHRAGGLWMWIALLIFAWSSVYWNLNGFYTRATSLFFDYEPPVWARESKVEPPPGKEPLSWEEAQAIGARLMDEQAPRARLHRGGAGRLLSAARQGPLRISRALVARHRRQGRRNLCSVSTPIRASCAVSTCRAASTPAIRSPAGSPRCTWPMCSACPIASSSACSAS